MAITSTHPLPQLAPVYLMTGYLDPERTKGGQAYPKSGTLLPVADRYFSYLTHTHEETLIATDGKGLLRSFDSKLEPLQPKQHLNQQPLKLNVLPQGLVRQAFFANLADWQKVLVDEIRKAKLAHAYKTLPFRFEKKDLRTPEEDDEVGREAHSGFKEGMKYFGQLFPRVQAVLFLVPAGILSGGKVKATLRKDGNVVTTFTEDGNGLKRTFEKKNSLTYALESAEYVCYSHASTDGSLAEGFYTLEIPGSALRKERFPSDSPILTGGLRFGCDVKFSLRTLYGDFDYHVLNLVSVESALLSNFPDTFVHLQKSLFTPAAPGGTAPGGGSAGEDGGKARASQSVKTTLKSWAEGFEWAHAKRQMALGYLNADNEGRIKSLLSAVLDCLQDGESDSMGHSAKVVKGFWVLVTKGPALNKEWQKIFDSVKILEKNLGKLDLVRQAVDANFVTRVFQETRWQRYILDELRAAEKLRSDGKAVTNKFVLELVKKDASPKALRALMKDGIPREARNFEKLFESNSKAAVKALWMLDVAYTAYSVASAVKDLSQKDAEAEVQDRRLADALAKYAEKQKGSTHPLVLERLDGLRKLSDAARSGLSAAQLAAVKNSVEFTLKAAVVVPVVGELVGLAALGMEAMDLLKGLTHTAYEVYFGDAFANHKRLDLLDKEYAVNVRSVLKAGRAGHEQNLTVQFRLRALALLGFLRLLHRCGSRLEAKEEFARKVKEYRLEDYVKTYLLSTQPTLFPVFRGYPIDQLWLYSFPGENPHWKENWNGKAYPGIPGGAYTLNFQSHFPIHGMDAKGILELAETFCLNFDGIISEAPIHCAVQARKNADSKWIGVRDCDFLITPLTEIRVLVVFKGEKDLTGIPISIQLVRTDTTPDVLGPVYKTLIVPATLSLDGKGEDQGLIEAEKIFADGKHYCAVIHPHYYFRETLYMGVKPLGHIGVVPNPKMEVGFKIGAGTGGKMIWIMPDRFARDFPVHLPLNLSPMVQMICERSFLEYRGDKQEFRKLFHDLNLPRYIGVILKEKGKADGNKQGETASNKYVYYPGTVGTLKQDSFFFEWGENFKMLLLFHSRAYGEGWEKQKTIRFPAFIQTQEFTGINTVGPEYPVEVCSLRTHKVQWPGTVTVESLGPELKELGLMGGEVLLPGGPLEFTEPGYLWACLAKFTYSLEVRPDEIETQKGFKPFSGTLLVKNGHYAYGFSISTPEPVGLNVANFLELELPALPETLFEETDFSNSDLVKKFVTEKRVHRSLNIRQVDLK